MAANGAREGDDGLLLLAGEDAQTHPALARSPALLLVSVAAGPVSGAQTGWGRAARVVARALGAGTIPLFAVVCVMDSFYAQPFQPLSAGLSMAGMGLGVVGYTLAARRDSDPSRSAVLSRALHGMPSRTTRQTMLAVVPVVCTAAMLLASRFIFIAVPTPALRAAVPASWPEGSDVLLLRAVQVVFCLALLSWFMGIWDTVLRTSWWMLAAVRTMRDFGEGAHAAAAEVLRTRKEAGLAAAKPGVAASAVAAAAEQAGDRIQALYEEAQLVVHTMNGLFELPASCVVGGLFVLLLGTGMGLQRADEAAFRVQILWFVSLPVAIIGIVGYVARVGDEWHEVQASVLGPAARLRFTRALGGSYSEALFAGVERADLSFRAFHLSLTTFTFVRLIFGMALTVALAFIHLLVDSFRPAAADCDCPSLGDPRRLM